MWWLIREFLKRFSRFKNVEIAIKERQEFELMSRQEINDYQLAKFNDIWKFACSHIAYYRNLQKELNLPLSFSSLTEMSKKVPILEKSTVQANPELFVPENLPTGFWARTSGSTGTPMKCYWDKNAYIESQRDKYYHQSLWGIDIWDKTVLLWGYYHFFNDDFKGKIAFIREIIIRKIRNKIRFSVYEITHDNLKYWYQQISQKNIRFLYTLPNIGYLLARANKNERPSDTLKLVVVGGEPIFPYQKKLIEQVMGCPVAIEYGTIEIGLLASSYPDSKMHVCEKGVFIETLPTSDNKHEIIVTNLRNKGFPLIRYRIGDFVESPLVQSKQGTATIGSIIGRTRDVIISASGQVFNGKILSNLFEKFPEITQYQLIQENINQVVVRLVCCNPLSQKAHSAIEMKLLQILGQDTEVEIHEVKKIEPTDAGKHKFIISKVASQHEKILL
jgi:phenylacetate-CoA ligase